MRISDWSSDVCSSDLTSVLRQAGVRSPPMLRSACRLSPAASGLMGGYGSAFTPNAFWNRDISREATRRGPTPWWNRSEEPTSELQSIMRLPYAVYSLYKTTPVYAYVNKQAHS